MRHLTEWVVVVFGLMFVLACEVFAVAPLYVSDAELANYPIIVVAKWDKARLEPHTQYQAGTDHVVTKLECYTRLDILAAVKGKVEPGEHDLLINYGISWADDGTQLSSGTSTEMSGDVHDITKPCLWFLQRRRSWDENRKHEFLTVGNYREIQPLELQEFFVALGGRDAQTEVPKLLAAEKPLVSQRTLHYICGGRWPRPFSEDLLHDPPSARGILLRGESDRVWNFLQAAAKHERRLATSVFAELAGEAGIEKVRTLLDDQDADVRGIAVDVLAHHRDEHSLPRFTKAVQGLKNATIACKIIEELAAWKDERTVPALISFLQNDGFAYQHGDDIGVPALKSQQALKTITGHEFPFDVATSQKAWEGVRRINDKAERTRLLEKLAPGGSVPLVAAAVGTPSKKVIDASAKAPPAHGRDGLVVAVRLRNVSPRPVTILEDPSGVEYSWPSGSSFHATRPWPDDEDEASEHHELSAEEHLEFITIPAGEYAELEVTVSEGFLIAEPAKRELSLSFLASGKRQGVKAWMGTLKVEFGADWKYRRETKQIEEFWPNGNLKVTGRAVNGIKSGEWHFFNEEGDRIKIVYYGLGRGTATCNPEHPDNKGAGKRPPR